MCIYRGAPTSCFRERDLHSTTIKNEAAYFGCVKQLTGLLPVPPPAYGEGAPRYPSTELLAFDHHDCGGGGGARTDPALPPIYVIGDSHCLATGWRVLSINGTNRILRPMLVTGLKCWHMRDDEDFYPKANFDGVVKKIPVGSEVIFLFGACPSSHTV